MFACDRLAMRFLPIVALGVLGSTAWAQSPPLDPSDPAAATAASPDETPGPDVAGEDADQTTAPDLATTAKQAKPAKPAKQAKQGRAKKVQVSGFLTAMYKFRVDHDGDGKVEPDAFRIGKAVVRFSGKIDRHLGYVIEIDPRSPTLIGVLRDGYITVRKLIPHHELRIGQQKTPWGYENWQSSTALYFTSRTELSEGLGRGLTHRDLGVGLVGKVPLSEGLRLEDAIAVVNGDGFGVQGDTTHLKNVWGHLGVRYRAGDWVIHAGASGAIGDQIEPADPGQPPNPRTGFRRLGADLEVDHPWAFLGAEYAIGANEDPAESGMTETEQAYFVTLAVKTPWHLGPVARYDAADLEGFSRWTVGGYWGEPGARVRAFVDYEYFEDDLGKHDARVESQLQIVF